jgi:hypothetical protein
VSHAMARLGPDGACRWEANASGGRIDSGDLEVRVLPDGQVVYGILYDLTLPSTYLATDCPPGAELPPIETDIPAFLNTRPPGRPAGGLRPAGPNFRLQAEGVSDVIADADPGASPTASWDLTPE